MKIQNSIRSQQYGLTVLRLILGTVFFVHGAQKVFVYGLAGAVGAFEGMGVSAPALTAVFATGAEFLGGLALILGLFTRFAAIPLAVTMLGALVTVHLEGGFFLPQGYEYVITLLGGSVAIALTGPGALALDNVVGREGTAQVSGVIGKRDTTRAAA